MEQKKTVGIWIRVSTEDQAKGESPEHHEKRAQLYAEAKGWDVKVVYHLEAVSGKSVIEHPEAKKMLRDIKDGAITGLIFSKLARLARNTKELLEFADYFDKHHADLISLGESIDTSTPAGRLFYTVIAATTQFEREEIASRVAASVPIRAKLAKPLSGKSPYGFKWVNKKLVIDEQQAPILKLMYDLFIKHKRKKTVAEELNRMGYRSAKGFKFSGTAIRRILIDPAAKGIRRSNYTQVIGNAVILKPQSEWVMVPCPQIVELKTWDEVNQILGEQQKTFKKPGPKAVHLLSGFIKCACSKKMYVYHETSPVYVCRPCKNRIPAEDLHEIYYEQLKTFLLTETDVADYLSKTDAEITKKGKQHLVLGDEAANLRKRKTELVNMRLAHELTKESFAELFKPMEERLFQIDEQLPQLQAEIDFLKIQHVSSGTVLQEAKDLYTRWPSLSFEEKRGVVEVITDSITVGKEDISIKLAYIPTQPSLNAGKSAQSQKTSITLPF